MESSNNGVYYSPQIREVVRCVEFCDRVLVVLTQLHVRDDIMVTTATRVGNYHGNYGIQSRCNGNYGI